MIGRSDHASIRCSGFGSHWWSSDLARIRSPHHEYDYDHFHDDGDYGCHSESSWRHTGLHSYHNDSPPFSGATNPTSGEPEVLHLNPKPNTQSAPKLSPNHSSDMNNLGPQGWGNEYALSMSNSSPRSGFHPGAGMGGRSGSGSGSGSGSAGNSPGSQQDSEGLQRNGTGAGPSAKPQNDSKADPSGQTAGDSNGNSTAQSSRPKIERVSTSPNDVTYSSSRSRRLVSGYMFGNPPEEKGKGRRDSETTVRRLSVVSKLIGDTEGGNPGMNGVGAGAGIAGTIAGGRKEALEESEEDTPHPLHPRPSSVNSFRTNPTSQPDEDTLSSVSSRGSPGSTSQRGELFDNGRYEDALNGVTDGEADADVRAMQATGGGSEGFMKGLQGEEGRYNFPTHRLRRRMKGESANTFVDEGLERLIMGRKMGCR